MNKAPSHQLQSRRFYKGERAGKALAKWLNEPPSSPKFKWQLKALSGRSIIQELVIDAQVVYDQLKKYKTVGQFTAARRSKKLPPQFAKSYDRLNETLGLFTHAPRIDLADVYSGRLVSSAITDDCAIAHVSTQVDWLLLVIEQNAILKIRRCKHCEDWFFARFSHQTFCKRSCQSKEFSSTEDFKAKRQKYMHDYRSK